MSAYSTFRAAVRRVWRKTVDGGIRKVVSEVAKKIRLVVLTFIALVVLALLVRLLLPFLPDSWQSPIIKVLVTLKVPAALLPDDPERYSAHLGLGPKGFAYATSVFTNAISEGTPPVLIDTPTLSTVVVCHEWQGRGPTNVKILETFVHQHPACFKLTGRAGGGFAVEALTGGANNGDVVIGVNGTVLGFACECRDRLQLIQAELTNRPRP